MDRVVVEQKLVVHNYEAINWHMVHSIVQIHLVNFSRFARTLWQQEAAFPHKPANAP